MARGTQHRKRRPPAHARVAEPAPKSKRPQHQSWEDQLFFSRLRVHAKWVFVLLAIVFAAGFVLFGVGSGSTGISDILGNFFNGVGGSSGSSLSSLEKATLDHPKRPQAWRNLATKLEQDQKTPEAIAALAQYTQLKPTDQDALLELASLYQQQAGTYAQAYREAQTTGQLAAPAGFRPAAGTGLGKAYVDPTLLEDPIRSAISESTSAAVTAALQSYTSSMTSAVGVYRKLIAREPRNATFQLQLGQAAQSAGDSATAKAAYKRFLALAPTDPQASAVKQALKQLAQPTASSSPSG